MAQPLEGKHFWEHISQTHFSTGRTSFPTTKDIITHECAPRFAVQLFLKYLHGYTLHQVLQDPDSEPGQGTPMTLSQHCFGWPEHRPRSYCVLTKDATCTLTGREIQVIHDLFRKPNLDVSHLYCAPQDWVFVDVTCVQEIFWTRPFEQTSPEQTIDHSRPILNCDVCSEGFVRKVWFSFGSSSSSDIDMSNQYVFFLRKSFFLIIWKELIEGERYTMAHKACKPLNSRFEDLLPGILNFETSRRLETYSVNQSLRFCMAALLLFESHIFKETMQTFWSIQT